MFILHFSVSFFLVLANYHDKYKLNQLGKTAFSIIYLKKTKGLFKIWAPDFFLDRCKNVEKKYHAFVS